MLRLARIGAVLCVAAGLVVAACQQHAARIKQSSERDNAFREFFWPAPEEQGEITGVVDSLVITNATDDDISSLIGEKIRRITHLSIRADWIGSSTDIKSISDSGVEHIANGPPIYHVTFEEQHGFTIKGLEQLLLRQKQLRRVDLFYCHRVSESEVSKLKDEYADVDILLVMVPDPPDAD